MKTVKVHKKRYLPPVIKKTLIAVGTMLFIFVAGGTAYVYYSGKSEAKLEPVVVESTTKEEEFFSKPTQPGPNTPVGLAIQALLSPTPLGSNTSISVRTTPTSHCKIEVKYNSVLATDSGLAPRDADIYGNVNWAWTVDKATPLGTWPVRVFCELNGKSGQVIGDLEVVK